MPRLSSLDDPDDRAEVIRAHEEVLDLLVAELGRGVGQEGSPAEQYECDDEIIRLIAHLVGQMRPDEGPERLCQKILGVGTSAANHVKAFLGQWFIAGLHGQISLERFESVWRSMVEGVFESPAWSGSNGRRGYELQEMWCELMGLDWTYRRSWTEGHGGTITRMKPLFQRWANARLTDSRSVRCFTAFAQTPAGRSLLPEALVWLRDASRRARGFWNEEEVADAVGGLLTEAIADERNLRRHAMAFGAFKDLLGQLCGLQNQIALGLRETLASPSGSDSGFNLD